MVLTKKSATPAGSGNTTSDKRFKPVLQFSYVWDGNCQIMELWTLKVVVKHSGAFAAERFLPSVGFPANGYCDCHCPSLSCVSNLIIPGKCSDNNSVPRWRGL